MESDAEQNAELYIKLFPYILRDFVFKSDLKTTFLLLFPEAEILNLLNIDSSPEGLKQALLYKSYIDNGEDLLDQKVKPVIEI